MKSWKTTLLGILTILGAAVTAAIALLDTNPATNPDMAQLWLAITAGIGLIAAKDSNVTGGSKGDTGAAAVPQAGVPPSAA